MRSLKKYLKNFLFVAGILCVANLTHICAEEGERRENVSRGKIIFSKYLSLEDINFNPETEFISANGDKYYKRNISAKKNFKKINNNQDYKLKGSLDLDVTFTYDKKSFVKVESPEELKSSKASKKWKIRNTSDIHPSDKTCLVSNRYAVYKKATLGVGDYLMDGHIDLICSHRGEVGVNTELN